MSPRPPSPRRERRLVGALATIGLLLTAVGTFHTVTRADAGVLPTEAAHSFGQPIWSGDLRGQVTTIGNVVTTCRPGSTAHPTSPGYRGTCEEVLAGTIGGDERTGSAPFPANNEFDLVYVDVDDDPRTHNSSTAVLRTDAGSEIVWAGLHWHGLLAASKSGRPNPDWRPPIDPDARFRVTVRTPGGETVDVEAEDRWDQPPVGPGGSGHRTYGAYRDITDLVRSGGDGAWTVGNVQTCTGPANALGCIGAWSITVVHASADQPARNINVWHGWDLAHNGRGGTLRFDADGIVPPPAGGEAELGIVAADGDRGRGPESVRYRTASAPEWTALGGPGRPLHPDDPPEFFNSTIDRFGEPRPDADASPNPRANLNLDIALIDGIPISGDDGGIQFEIDTTTRRDTIYAQVVHTAVPLFEPEISIDKTASADVADPGDVIEWTLDVANVGIEPIRDARITDPVPDGLELVPGSIRYVAGGPADLLGDKTPDEGDDEATWNAEDGVLTLHVGAGATATSGGTMGIAGAADGSDRITITFDTIWHGDEGSEILNEATAVGRGRELTDDPFGPITTEDRDTDRVVGRLLPVLVQDKTVERDRVPPGEESVFTITVHNRGRGPVEAGTTVVDELPDGLEVVATSPEAIVDEDSRTLTWGDLPALGAGEVWEARIRVSVPAGRWDERFENRLLAVPPPDVPIEVDHPCEDDPTRSCAEFSTPTAGWTQGKTLAPDTPAVVEHGSEVAFDLLVRNTGDVSGTPTAVDQLPPHLEFVSASHGGLYDDEEHQVVWSELEEIAPGEELSLRVVARMSDRLAEPTPDEEADAAPDGAIVNRFRLDPPADHPDPEVGDACEDDPRWSCAAIRIPDPPEPPSTSESTPPVRTAGPPAPGPRSPTGPPLPRTGSDPMGPVLIGLGLLGVGVAVLLFRRDPSHHEPAVPALR